MFDFVKQITFYSAYHQERRNVITHIFGVPIITFSLFVVMHWLKLKTVQSFPGQSFPITLAIIFYALATLYYLSLDRLFGIVAGIIYGVLLYAAYEVSVMGYQIGWIVFAMCQIGGWGSQIYAHAVFEHSRPAFLDNLFQAFVSAPLFVVAEVFFMIGIRKSLKEKVDQSLQKQRQLQGMTMRQS